MAKYMIHSSNSRQWYVEEFLIPSMLEQGIKESNISVYQDVKKQGNLEAFVRSLENLPKTGGTWHLQDDVIISSNFKQKTEEYNKGVVCGFCSCYSEDEPSGYVNPKHMWYSFPCIRIPNSYAQEFVEWFRKDVVNNKEYRLWVNKKKYDDSIFRIYLEDYRTKEAVLNLAPNIVNHIDYMIGGSLVNTQRNMKQVLSIKWGEPELLKMWEERLNPQ